MFDPPRRQAYNLVSFRIPALIPTALSQMSEDCGMRAIPKGIRPTTPFLSMSRLNGARTGFLRQAALCQQPYTSSQARVQVDAVD